MTPATTFRITRGGEPSPEQLAAITVALDELGHDDAARSVHAEARGGPAPAWTRAALAENVLGLRVRAPHQLPTARP